MRESEDLKQTGRGGGGGSPPLFGQGSYSFNPGGMGSQSAQEAASVGFLPIIPGVAGMDSADRRTRGSEQKSRKFLKSLIRKQPRDLLLMIGARGGRVLSSPPGISHFSPASWRSCIEAAIEAADQGLEVLQPQGRVAEFRKKVAKDRDLLVVAHDLIRKMSPRTGDAKPNFFQDCLMEVFDSLEQHIQNPVVLQSILQLMERGTMVLTTNYDNLLEIFGQQQGKPMESLDLKDKDKVLQWAKGHIKYGVLHIHGLYTDPCGMVLDPSGYKDVTQDPEVMEVLQNLYRTKSFLFLGCGETLRDQIFQALFLYTVKNKVDLEHYMLVLKENEDQFFKLQADMLLHGIKVVSYGDCFESFPEYVEDLTTRICHQKSPDPEQVDSTTVLGQELHVQTVQKGSQGTAALILREQGHLTLVLLKMVSFHEYCDHIT
ncbi:protein FAM118A isoform X2 [Sphaerodactylus townsendi]|uniref:protein FAM118A isoform X2 n=1 Tax=Sphaerodactylus townsendi TaxID=933632 RepID=UPI002026EE91|nr:protein FAM118A isoform X2 [Sphaerodactylus townsendi]